MRSNWQFCTTALLLTALVVASAGCSEAETQTPRGDDASVFDLVEECDVLAAHPDDPQRMATGVADDAIVPRLAILACEQSLENNPDEPRFLFQLGRALLAVGRKKDAVDRFKKAVNSDYAAAHAYMGDVHQFGFGVEVDPKKAFQAYKKAHDGGFLLAKDQIAQLQFDPSMYTGEFLALFFRGEHAEIKAKSQDTGLGKLVRNYVFNLVLAISDECENVLKPTSVPSFYSYRYPTTWKAQDDESVSVAIQTSIAERDAKAFLKRHGCEGAVARHLAGQIDSFFSQTR